MHADQRVDLSTYDGTIHKPGVNVFIRASWYIVNAMIFSSWFIPSYRIKNRVLKWFGAKVGKGVVIKPRVNIKYPWRLELGKYAWIGEGVWIDNIAEVRLGAHSCISQGVYLCTGNHDWSDPAFGLIIEPISIGEQSWVGAFSIICPGVNVGEGAVIAAGSVVTKDAKCWMIHSGNPASAIRPRVLSDNRKKS